MREGFWRPRSRSRSRGPRPHARGSSLQFRRRRSGVEGRCDGGEPRPGNREETGKREVGDDVLGTRFRDGRQMRQRMRLMRQLGGWRRNQEIEGDDWIRVSRSRARSYRDPE